MRAAARSLCVTVLALFGAVVLGVSWTMTTAIQLQATTALIMGGTFHSLDPGQDTPEFVTAYLDNAINGYINPAADAGTGVTGHPDNAVAVITPEEFFPLGKLTLAESVAEGRGNLHNCLNASGCVYNNDPNLDPEVPTSAPAATDTFIVFGYSQSAVVASLVKQDLIDNYDPENPPCPDQPCRSFDLVANPMRPNGGILMRFNGLPAIPILEVQWYGATPTDSPVVDDNGTADPSDDIFAYPTVDVANQYDALGGDFPVRPLNLLATANAVLGYVYLHGDSVNRPFSEAEFQGQYGDTSYYMFTTDLLPILMPLDQLGVPKSILRVLDAPLREIVEDAYDRDVSPGIATKASLKPFKDPSALLVRVLRAIPVGIDDGLEEAGLGRALGTTPAGPFGIDGPPLPAASSGASTLSAPEVGDNDESTARQAQSLESVEQTEEVTELDNTTSNETETETETETTDEQSEADEQADTTTPESTTPRITRPERPKVRGPIQFDSLKQRIASLSPSRDRTPTSQPTDDTTSDSTTTPNSTSTSGTSGTSGDDNKDAA